MLNTTTKNIMENVFLATLVYGVTMEYLDIVSDTLKSFQWILKLSKCRLFGSKLEFLGIDVTKNGKLPAETNTDAFRNITTPELF